MRVNRKALHIAAVLLIGLLVLHACTSSSVTSISGQLRIVSFEGTGGEGEPLESVPVSPLRLPEELLSEFMLETMQLPVALEPEFVPDEIIVKYKSGFEPSAVQSLSSFPAFIERKSNRDVAAGVRTVLKLSQSEKASLSIDAVRDRTLREIEWLNSLTYVEYAQPNYIYRPLALDTLIPNDEHYDLQWHYPLIKWDHMWDENLIPDLSGVTVAVIDTGIVREDWTKSGLNHEDFMDGGSTPFVDEYDFISNANLSFDGDGYDNDATDMGDNPDLDLASFHGTHVIGTIGAYTNNSIGVAGIAGRDTVSTSVKIMPLRALGYGGGTTDDIAEAIRYASKTGTYSSGSHGQADIINMSLGSTAQDLDLENAIDAAYSKGIVIVAAAGNNGSSVPFYPAAYENVISVSAVDIGANITSYSNFGSTIDIAAPGGDFSYDLNFDNYPDGVLSTFTQIVKNGAPTADTQTYAFNQGTSMAAPHVTGLAALIKAKTPGLSAAQIRAIIEDNAIDLGSAGRDDYYGHGLINAYASVHAAAGTTQGPVLFPYPKLFKLQGQDPSDTFTLENIGNTSDITIDIVNDAPWLTVTPPSGTVTSSGRTVTIDIDSTSIENGSTYIEMLTIVAEAGVADEYVYVMYNVNGFPTVGLIDIGPLYVVAIDLEANEIVDGVVTTFNDLYLYDLRGLPSGSYIIGASTNRDGDNYLFESNDVYGFYISLDQIVPVEVSSGMVIEDINFEVIDLFDNPSGQYEQKIQ